MYMHVQCDLNSQCCEIVQAVERSTLNVTYPVALQVADIDTQSTLVIMASAQ